LDRADAARHRIEQIAEVVGAVDQPLRREVVDRVVQRRIDPLAGRKLGLGAGDQIGGFLQLQKIGTHACRQNNVTHELYSAENAWAGSLRAAWAENDLLGLIKR